MTDITVDKATIALALEAIELNWRTDEGDAVTPILRAALAEPAPASKPVLLQCMGCERIGTQEQLSTSTDCDCWLHTQPAPVQEPQPGAYLMKHGQWSTNIETDEGMWLLEQFPSEDVQIPVYLAAQSPQGCEADSLHSRM